MRRSSLSVSGTRSADRTVPTFTSMFPNSVIEIRGLSMGSAREITGENKRGGGCVDIGMLLWFARFPCFLRRTTGLCRRECLWFVEDRDARALGNLLTERAGLLCDRILRSLEITRFADDHRAYILLRDTCAQVFDGVRGARDDRMRKS